jgi:hypothetical protein
MILVKDSPHVISVPPQKGRDLMNERKVHKDFLTFEFPLQGRYYPVRIGRVVLQTWGLYFGTNRPYPAIRVGSLHHLQLLILKSSFDRLSLNNMKGIKNQAYGLFQTAIK